jgi:hypothetical protein
VCVAIDFQHFGKIQSRNIGNLDRFGN